MAGRRRPFFEHDDPRGQPLHKQALCIAKMEDRELLNGYVETRPGCFHSVFHNFNSNNPLQVCIPRSQTGYRDLNERAKERQVLYMRKTHTGVWDPEKLPFVMRRNLRLHSLDVCSALVDLESSLEQNYSTLPNIPDFISRMFSSESAARTILEKWPLFNQDILTASIEDAMFMTLLPLLLEKGRKQFLLKKAATKVRLVQVGPNKYRADYVYPPTILQQQVLASTVGETCNLQIDGRKHQFFVQNASDTCLSLRTLNTGRSDNQRGDTTITSNYRGKTLQARFTISIFQYKVLETGTIDGWSALAKQWIDGENRRYNGEPLIKYEQLLRLQNGQGFYNTLLSGPQQELVAMFLEHLPEHCIQTVIAPPGTGKTAVLIEVAMQINSHGLEESPDDFLMIYAVNTNVNAQLTAEKFVAAGYPLDRIVRVIGERADDTNTLPRTVRVVRITDYTPNKQTNLIVSPYGTASKIFLPKEGHDSMFQKPAGVLFIDEISKATVAEAITLLTMTGPPVSTIGGGDPTQLPPVLQSLTAEKVGGQRTLLNVLPRNMLTQYIDPSKKYFRPLPPFGGYLQECFRANTYLTTAISHLCYHGDLVASPLCKEHDKRSEELLKAIGTVPMLSRIKSVLTWYDHTSHCFRNPVTQSLSNPAEADKVLDLAWAMVPLVGSDNILLVTPYKGQANVLLTKLRQRNQGTLRVASADETQGLEASVVIVSMVRANTGDLGNAKTAGFLADPRRCNVLLSRAKHLILLVGSKNHFLSTGAEVWCELLNTWAMQI